MAEANVSLILESINQETMSSSGIFTYSQHRLSLLLLHYAIPLGNQTLHLGPDRIG
jgi:hypothetical protein